MLKIRYVDEYPRFLGIKHRCDWRGKKLLINGCYDFVSETIYIANTPNITIRSITLLHELGHWAIHRFSNKLRWHYAYDDLWCRFFLFGNRRVERQYYSYTADILKNKKFVIKCSNNRNITW